MSDLSEATRRSVAGNREYWTKVNEEDLAGYVFGDVSVKATFTRENGATFVLILGAPRPGKVVPLRVEGREGIYHVGDDVHGELLKDLWMLRNKQLRSPSGVLAGLLINPTLSANS